MAHQKQDRYASVYYPFIHAPRNSDWRTHLVSSIIDGVYIGIARKLLWQEELEADRLSIEYLHRAGYRPGAFEELLMRVEGIERNHPAYIRNWLSTHPPIEKRLAHIRRHLSDLPENVSYTGVDIYHQKTDPLRQGVC
jgi:predicted Zn-dependent protease